MCLDTFILTPNLKYMKLDNAKRASIIKLIYMLIPLLVLLAAAIVYLMYDVKDLRYMGLAFVVLVLFFLIMSIFKFNYIVFYAGPDFVRIRFKTLTPFSSPNNSIQIKSENFKKYEIASSLGGFRKILFLFQETPSGLAKYPGIGFSALTHDELDKIRKAFDLILALNKSKKQ